MKKRTNRHYGSDREKSIARSSWWVNEWVSVLVQHFNVLNMCIRSIASMYLVTNKKNCSFVYEYTEKLKRNNAALSLAICLYYTEPLCIGALNINKAKEVNIRRSMTFDIWYSITSRIFSQMPNNWKRRIGNEEKKIESRKIKKTNRRFRWSF